jgi:hypothetical protein
MKNVNKNTNKLIEKIADIVIAIATIVGFISFSFMIACLIKAPVSVLMIYSTLTFISSIVVGKAGCVAFDYYTPVYMVKLFGKDE